MHAASDIADWWDEQHRISSKALDDMVDAHPNWFSVTVATLAETSMTLGAGLVDVLRLGEGVAEGGVKGYLHDGLRLLQVAPAAGKLSRFVLARVLVDAGGDICTWMSATKALRQVGVSSFATVDDLARAAGFGKVSELGGAFVDALLPALRSLGARVTALPVLRDISGVMASVRGNSVVMFSVEWKMGAEQVGHTLYAFRDLLGRLRIADRTGAVVSGLAELEKYYPGIAQAKVYGSAALVEGPRILLVDGVGVLAMEVRAQLVANPETVAQTLEVIKRSTFQVSHPPASTAPMTGRQSARVPGILGAQAPSYGSLGAAAPVGPRRGILGAGSPTQPAGAAWAGESGFGWRTHVVSHGDWLSKLAQRYYRDMYKWPLIYAANRSLIGSNPNRIVPGQQLRIPPLPRVSAVRAAGH